MVERITYRGFTITKAADGYTITEAADGFTITEAGAFPTEDAAMDYVDKLRKAARLAQG